MKDMTLIFLVKDDEVLLAMKKRGFGEGRWNGVGGKLDSGETIEQALIRECQEEIEVTPMAYEQVALLEFDAMFKDERTTLMVHAFLCTEWKGQPIETEEMRPQWFKTSKVPYDKMWQDDKFWLPQVLSGKKLKGTFLFDEQDNLVEHRVQETTEL
jgi:mutator protein MutT